VERIGGEDWWRGLVERIGGEDWWRGLVAVDEREWMARERWISGSAVGWWVIGRNEGMGMARWDLNGYIDAEGNAGGGYCGPSARTKRLFKVLDRTRALLWASEDKAMNIWLTKDGELSKEWQR
jgi:hypothetical protein